MNTSRCSLEALVGIAYLSFREWSGDRDPVGRRGRRRRPMWIVNFERLCRLCPRSFLHGLLMLARDLEPRQVAAGSALAQLDAVVAEAAACAAEVLAGRDAGGGCVGER